MGRTGKIITVCFGALALAGVAAFLPQGSLLATSPAAQAAASEDHAADHGQETLSMREFMGHVMQFAAQGIWSRAGTIYDETGERDLTPKTDEDWEDAESAALILAELTNVLLMPGRSVDEAAWHDTTLLVREIALDAAMAAESRDEAAWWDAGARLDPACEACHDVYLYPQQSQ